MIETILAHRVETNFENLTHISERAEFLKIALFRSFDLCHFGVSGNGHARSDIAGYSIDIMVLVIEKVTTKHIRN